jgi:arylsulfatase A-like enzyme
MTGRYQHRLAVGLEEPLRGARANVGLPPDHPTLPSLLRDTGYATMLLGKWHLGKLPTFGPLQSGYEHFFGFRGGAVDYFTHKSGGLPDSEVDLWDDDTPVEETGYLTHLLGDRTVAAIAEFARSDRPFFLSLHFSAPHWPWEGPDDEAESRRIRNLAQYDAGNQETYANMILAMDREIGRVIEALRTHGLADNTIVVFTSDNGGERFADTWPFTGRKCDLLEGGLRVPGILSWPARIRPGQVSDQVLISMDFMPTFLAAADVAGHPDYPPDGIDLLPILTGDQPPLPRQLFWRYKFNSQKAMRDGDWKYLKIRDNTFLFNVVDDPLERANWKERRRDIYDRMVADHAAWEATMLPYGPETFSNGPNGRQIADRIGVEPPAAGGDPSP